MKNITAQAGSADRTANDRASKPGGSLAAVPLPQSINERLATLEARFQQLYPALYELNARVADTETNIFGVARPQPPFEP